VHTNQKRFQCERPREKKAVLRERKDALGILLPLPSSVSLSPSCLFLHFFFSFFVPLLFFVLSSLSHSDSGRHALSPSVWEYVSAYLSLRLHVRYRCLPLPLILPTWLYSATTRTVSLHQTCEFDEKRWQKSCKRKIILTLFIHLRTTAFIAKQAFIAKPSISFPSCPSLTYTGAET